MSEDTTTDIPTDSPTCSPADTTTSDTLTDTPADTTTSDTPTDSPTPISAAIIDENKYGPTGDGGYNTPYSVTVFYRESQIFQIAVAALSELCQAVPIIDGADLSSLADVCEHPSPELIIFGDIDYKPEHIQKYFKRGFQKIHVFMDVETASVETASAETASAETASAETASAETASAETADTTTTTTAESPQSQLAELSKIDNRLSLFSTRDMNDNHVKLISNLTTLYIMDLITCGVFPSHKSFIRTINHERGRELIQYLHRVTGGPREIGALLIRLATQFNGYEHAEELCARWRGITEERKLIARDRINSSPLIDGTLYVYNGDLRNEIIAGVIDVSTAPSTKYIVLWYVNKSDIKVNVLKGKLWKDGDKSPAELVAPFSDRTCGVTNSNYTIVECTLVDKKFLPFM